jgi:hypothetical protein
MNRGWVLLLGKQTIERGSVANREPDLHLEGSIKCGVSKWRESLSLNGMISSQSDAVIREARIERGSDSRRT